MPELPEVETIRQDLRRSILGKKIINFEVLRPQMVKSDQIELLANISDNHFSDIKRYGKLLVFHLQDGDKEMHVHLKMTGQLIYEFGQGVIIGGHPSAAITNLPNQHTRFIWEFDDDSKLFFNDIRTFGYVKLISKNIFQPKGIEPLTENFTFKNFRESLKNKKTSIKACLLNQELISGIGNIYADEICFAAKVNPTKPVNELDNAELKKIFSASNRIIKKAIEKRGTTFSDYRDASGRKGGYYRYLKVYDRDGQNCPRCKDEKIIKFKHAGRGTHYCPKCQGMIGRQL